MRNALCILALALLAVPGCTRAPGFTDADTARFEQVAERFQQLYSGGGGNCEGILMGVAEDVTLIENGERWGYSELARFCPHLPAKQVLETWADRTLIGPALGYDFVTQIYENESASPRRETTVRVWRNTGGEWKVIRMSSVLSAIALEKETQS